MKMIKKKKKKERERRCNDNINDDCFSYDYIRDPGFIEHAYNLGLPFIAMTLNGCDWLADLLEFDLWSCLTPMVLNVFIVQHKTAIKILCKRCIPSARQNENSDLNIERFN